MTIKYQGGLFVQERILRRPEVQARTGLSRSGIYAAMEDGDFPLPIRLTKRAVGWKESTIAEWIDSRIKKSPAGHSGV